MNHFEFPEDREFFANLLTGGDVSKLSKFKDCFDFRSKEVKRKEFALMRDHLFKELVKKNGYRCAFRISPKCTPDKNLQLDHIIPIATNELNKKLRKIRGKNGKKTVPQFFGSNYIGNLALLCEECNRAKRHFFLDPEAYKIIFKNVSK
jgi:hypothetical protein